MEITIHYLPIAVAVIVNFIIGWLWYGPLFGKAWATEMKMDPNASSNKQQMFKGMFLMLVGNFLFAYVYAHDIFVWKHFPGFETLSNLNFSLSSAFFMWLGFYVPTHLGNTVWESKSWKLTMINLLYHLVSLFAAAMILTSM